MIKKFKDIKKYRYGCVMLMFDISNWDELLGQIEEEDLYKESGEDGLSTEPHVSILYGFLDLLFDKKLLIKKLEGLDPIKVGFDQKPSLFKNEDCDVLKIGVDKKGLSFINEQFKLFPHSNRYSTYEPHLTIAYLKKGMGDKYIESFKLGIPSITANQMQYSSSTGEKIDVHI